MNAQVRNSTNHIISVLYCLHMHTGVRKGYQEDGACQTGDSKQMNVTCFQVEKY